MNDRITKSVAPHILEGGIVKDHRGAVGFVNDFNFSGVKRFYTVENCGKGQVRAWHGHKREAKYFFAVSGKALVGAVKIDDWKSPSKDAEVFCYTLKSEKPQILYIPEGYANGFKSLTADTKLIIFSTSTLEQSKEDDIRFDAKYWDIWD